MADDYFFDKSVAPSWLSGALGGANGELSLRRACQKASIPDLEAAHSALYPHHEVYRKAVWQVLTEKREKESSDVAERRHQEGIAEARRSFRLAVLAIVIALIALAISALQILGWHP